MVRARRLQQGLDHAHVAARIALGVYSRRKLRSMILAHAMAEVF